jgi:hypothetical protein
LVAPGYYSRLDGIVLFLRGSISVSLPSAVWIPIGLGLATLGGVCYVRYQEAQVIRRRPRQDADSIYATYYASSGIPKNEFIEIWREIAGALNIPDGKLRPEDRFGKDIGRYLITSEELDTLSECGLKRAREHGLSIDFKINTVDEYVRAFTRKP